MTWRNPKIRIVSGTGEAELDSGPTLSPAPGPPRFQRVALEDIAETLFRRWYGCDDKNETA